MIHEIIRIEIVLVLVQELMRLLPNDIVSARQRHSVMARDFMKVA